MKTRSLWAGFVPMLCLLAAFLLAGCATTKTDWDARVGHYTFDQAVADYGLPDRQAILSNGNRVTEWIQHSSGGVSFGFGVGSYGPNGGVGVGQSVSTTPPDKVMRLTFGPDGKLSAWSKNY